ncbi:MAG: 5'-methylthioadenosine/adenosylhomocysteine nucleosidase [Clostridiales bacterium]|nr:5'-methylthioadenosine/adenosylhomocysteine nucleosidase [Clostridiales bacterium]
MIGIIGAMEVEVEGLKEKLRDLSIDRVGMLEFSTGTLCGVECVIARCGVGKVNAAMCAQTMILRYAPSVVLNTGVAGGMGKGIAIGDLVVAENVVQHDMDTSAVGDPKGFLSGIDQVFIPCWKPLVTLIQETAQSGEFPPCHLGTVATGDQFINNRETLKRLREEFGAAACEMEGGSIGQVCVSNRVPFAVIRAISDNADDDSHMDYQEFVGPAAQTSIRLVESLVKRLGQMEEIK